MEEKQYPIHGNSFAPITGRYRGVAVEFVGPIKDCPESTTVAFVEPGKQPDRDTKEKDQQA